MFNAFLFAFFFVALSRCEKRALLTVFSEKLCIKTTKDGRIKMTAQCYDLDPGHPVVESHARFYTMDKNLNLVPLRIEAPDDEMGACLFTSLPSKITHDIDYHSVLSPERSLPFVRDPSGLILRQADSLTGGRDDIVCPVCGDAYGTYERLRKHIRYNQLLESVEGYEEVRCHVGFECPEVPPLTISEIKEHMKENIAEVLVIVEGIDPQVSGTFQAIESYKFEDIVWEGEFEDCLSVQGKKFVVDMSRFHKVKGPAKSIPKGDGMDEGDIERPVRKLSNAATEDDVSPKSAPLTNGSGHGNRHANGHANGHAIRYGNGHANSHANGRAC